MVDLSGLGISAGSIFMSWITWLLFGFLLIMVSFGSLYMKKKGRYRFPVIIIQDNGNGKVNVVSTRAGWFKSKKMFGGLLDYKGEKRLEVKDGRIVQHGGTADFHEINYLSGLVLIEKEDDPKILIPIDRLLLNKESQEIIARVAPGSYRNASSIILEETKQETTADWQQVATILLVGFVGVILFISIIMTIQYVKNTMADALVIHKEALSFYEKTLSRMSAVPVSSAP
jgi:hypothetical protein